MGSVKSLALPGREQVNVSVRIVRISLVITQWHSNKTGADKSLNRTGRKQSNVSVTMTRISLEIR
jgi:hypothetical protein